MNTREAELLRQRQLALLRRSAAQRRELAAQLAPLRRPLAVADRVRTGWAWLRAHPEWPLGGLLVVAALRPGRALRWAGRVWWGWRTLRRLQRQWLPPASG